MMYLLNSLTTLQFLLLSITLHLNPTYGDIICPPYNDLPFCTCFVLDDQLHIQCSGNDIRSLETSLTNLNGPVKSFSVYDLDPKLKVLPNGLTDNVRSPILHFSLSHSEIENLDENSLRGVSKTLENLSITSSKLQNVPQSSLSSLRRLKVLDFESNQIRELNPYTFRHVLLQKVNLKANQIETISQDAFFGLEETVMEIDMSENKLKNFPFYSLQGLGRLSSLNLAWNEIIELSVEVESGENVNSQNNLIQANFIEWGSLKYLNLNSNYLRRLGGGNDSLLALMGNLRTLTIHSNFIETVEEDTFQQLQQLESIDLSHNKIRHVKSQTFQFTPNILTIELSNNYITVLEDGLFNNLQNLKEIFLNGNNLLQLTHTTFQDSMNLQTIYLQQNSLKSVESGIFIKMKNLTEVKLSENLLNLIPEDMFLENENLNSLSLDKNKLKQILPGTFRNCKSLRELRLQHNEIPEIPIELLDDIVELEELNLDNNMLETVHGLHKLKSLKQLSISGNNLPHLTKESIPKSDLSSISFKNNKIRAIGDEIFKHHSGCTFLDLGDNELGRLGPKAFTGLKSLERLYLQRNNITRIHNATFRSNTPVLQHLDLSYNSLESISSQLFNGLIYLEEINLSHNQIVTVKGNPFDNLISLRVLDLSNNNLVRLAFPNNNGLEIAKLCCNQLEQISGLTNDNTNIKELDLSENLLDVNDLSEMSLKSLETLEVSGNNLSSLLSNTFIGFPSLTHLFADKCHISNIPSYLFHGNAHLTVLRLNENLFSEIPDTIFGESKSSVSLSLRELYLSHNQIKTLPYKLFTQIPSISLMHLGGNQITSLNFSKLSAVEHLEIFDIHGNKLTKLSGSIANSFPNIEVLDFLENNLSHISNEVFNNLSLTHINLGENFLQQIPFALSTVSHVLNLSCNPLINFYTENHGVTNFSVMDLYLNGMNVSFLTTDEFKIYPNLHRLVIKRNPLKEIPENAFMFLDNLTLLDISENIIESLTTDSFNGLVLLKSLNVSFNRIKKLNFVFHGNLSELQELDISHNEISHVLPTTFDNLISLVSLKVANNRLSTLQIDAFGSQQLLRLALLDISNNFIQSVPITVLEKLETQITTLVLEGNPINCACESLRFLEWLDAHPKLGFLSSNLKCGTPEDMNGRLVLESQIQLICPASFIAKFGIQDILTSSAKISWEYINNTDINQQYMLVYHTLEKNDGVKFKFLPISSQNYFLSELEPDSQYKICLMGFSNLTNYTNISLANLLTNTDTSGCTQIRTLGMHEGNFANMFERRLGVLIGGLIGLLVFTALIITLVCFRLRKKKARGQESINGKSPNNKVGDVVNGTNGIFPTEITNTRDESGTIAPFYNNGHSNSFANNFWLNNHNAPKYTKNGNGTITNNGNGITSRNLSSNYIPTSYRNYQLVQETGIMNGKYHPTYQDYKNAPEMEIL